MTCPVYHPHGRDGFADPEEWMRRRRYALRLLGEDWMPSEVAREVGVSSTTVSQWKHRYMPETHRRPLHGPCKEPGCTSPTETRYGYCVRHAKCRVWSRGRPSKERVPPPVPCRNAPKCERLTGAGGARGLCPLCYQRLRRVERLAEVGL